jgi:hypothetical protein
LQISGVSLALTWPHRLCLLRVLLGGTPLLQAFPFPSSLEEVTLHPPSLASLFIYRLRGKCPVPPLQWNPPHDSHCYKLSHSKVAGRGLPVLPSPAGLFIYSSVWDCPSPTHTQGTPPSLLCVFLLLLFIIQFFSLFFPLVGVNLSRGTMLIWPRVVCGSTMYRLAHLVLCFS